MSEEKIAIPCPECGAPNLSFKEKELYCSQCDKIVGSEMSKEEAVGSLTNWVKTKQAKTD